jgi:hypothetical protein
MILFKEEFKVFFDDLELTKIADQCLRTSLNAFNVNNGNIPKWTIALDALKSMAKGEIELNEPYICINQNNVDSEILIDIVTIYKSSGNTGSRLLCDEITDKVRELTNNLSLDVSSGLEIFSQKQTFPNNLHMQTQNQNIFRGFVRISLRIE